MFACDVRDGAVSGVTLEAGRDDLAASLTAWGGAAYVADVSSRPVVALSGTFWLNDAASALLAVVALEKACVAF